MGRKDKTIDTGDTRFPGLGTIMRQARQSTGITLTKMAEQAGYTKNYLSSIENGNGRPSKELLERYEKVLNIERGELTRILRKMEESTQQQQNFAENASRHPLREDWGEAPDIHLLYGRGRDLEVLERWIINDRCKMTTVFGIGGVGKTSLATWLAKQCKEHFEYVFWRSLQSMPSLESVLKKCILLVSNQKVTDPPPGEEEQITLLLEYLRAHRCLLLLDNFESVLQESNRVGVYREGYKGYGKLLQRLGEAEHQSCLLLTSREKPGEILPLEGKNSPVRSMQLGGIRLLDGQNMLKYEELSGSDEAWARLIELYGGNPLALKLIAASIRELFGGYIARFLEEGAPVFGGIYDLLQQQFSRLSTPEQDIMYWLAIEQDEVSVADLREDMGSPFSMRSLQENLDSLRRRSMIEISNTSARCTLLPVIMEYVIEELITRVCEEIEAEDLAVLERYALTKAQSKEYARNRQVQLILKPLAEYLLTTFGKENSEQLLKNMLSLLRGKHTKMASGYAAANILSLLLQLGIDIQGYDFSHMAVWQAYLQEVELSGVNFAYADMQKSVFANTFGSVLSLTLSADDRLLAAGTANGEIRLWQAPTGVPHFTFQGHTDWVTSVAFSPDGSLLASGSDDKTIRLWRVGTGESIRVLSAHTDWIRSVVFSPDGTLLVSSSDDQTICIWQVATGECVHTLQGNGGRIYSIAFTPTGELLASANDDHTIHIWQVATGECVRVLQGHEGRVNSVVIDPDGDLLASGSDDHTIRLWRISDGECRGTLRGHNGSVQSVTISPDGALLASGSIDRTVRIWSVATKECLKTLQGHHSNIYSVVMSQNGEWLFSGGDDHTIRQWEVERGVGIRTLQGYSNRVYSIIFSADGSLLVSGSDDRTLRIWDVHTGKCLKTLQGYSTWRYSLAFSPDGSLLANGNEDDKTIWLWNVHTGERLKILHGHDHWVRSVAFSPDGVLLASGIDDCTVRLWRISTGESLEPLQGHTKWVRSVAFSPDGELLVSGSDDHTVRLWRVETGECVKILQEHNDIVYSVSFSTNGKLLASGSGDHTIRIWDVATGVCIKTLRGHENWVWSAVFSMDGETLVSGSEDQTIRVWQVSTGECLQVLPAHSSWLQYVNFHPQTSIVASSGHDGTIKLWSAPNLAYLRTLRSPGPYEGMNIIGVKGLTDVQKTILKELGGIEQDV